MEGSEIEAMRAIDESLSQIEDDAQKRVLDWAAAKFGHKVTERVIDKTPDQEDSNFESVGDLVHASSASSGPERALAVAYWLQAVRGNSGWSGAEVNSALKDLGHGLPNVTNTLSSLMARKPALVIQAGKSGKGVSARKTYKLTAEGLRTVESKLGASK